MNASGYFDGPDGTDEASTGGILEYGLVPPQSPSWQVSPAGPDGALRYREVICADCRRALDPVFADLSDADGRWEALQAADALCISLTGGYGEFLDTFDGPLQAYLCRDCAIGMLEAHPWLKDLASQSLSISVGHRCGEDLVWVPEPDCSVDPDRHGWRPVWQVFDPQTNRPSPDVFDTPGQATEHADRLGIAPEFVRRVLIGNVRRQPLNGT